MLINKKIFVIKNVIYLSNNIHFSDVVFILKEYEKMLPIKFFKIFVNLKYVSKINTSILLLMINFIKICIYKKKIVRFLYVSSSLIKLGKLYNLNSILYQKDFRGYHVKRKN